ncbi:MAG: hypothetical protein CVT75_02630 [Alphaproteobacteria bacterium HGW-Alphaproteobacteria-14]|nr:MAG: hypothetical protein CVT75_02630 [Alphaproteobacteria bacterium HGW-Alphaproteobacteria-14]
MKNTTQLLGAVSAIALVVMSSAPAWAEGTSAGSTITNNVSVIYDVGGVTQNAATASDTFTVDRRVNVNVNFAGAAATSVSPGQQDAVIAFDVTNLSNSTVDLDLSAALTVGTGANIANFQIYRDTDGDRVLSAAELAAGPITFLDEVGEDVTLAVIVIADIGLGAGNGDDFDVTLTANAHAAGGAGLGAELVGTTGANTNGVDTVLFDGAGATDQANQGDFSDTGTYTVAGALVTVAKTSRIVSDPVNGSTNPKAIPGATVEYCITVSNATGAATATNIGVSDDLPFDVTYDAAFGIFVDGNASCANGVAGGSFSTGTGPAGADQVLGGLANVAAGQTRSLYFQVLIN